MNKTENKIPRLILAPMATLSHEAFRRSVEKFGFCDEYFTEMINATSLLTMGPFEKYYLQTGPSPEKIVWQLTGWNAEDLGKAAEILCPLGGKGIDINMGCSAPQIYKTGAGISWMTKPLEETEKAVLCVKKSINEYEKQSGHHLRLSVKCRLGDEDWNEEKFFTFLDMLVSSGVEMLTLHARTKKEKMRGKPKYEIAEKTALRFPELDVIVNGEIKDRDSALFAMEKAPHAKGLMIARMAAEKPWIFQQLYRDLSNQDKKFTVDRQTLALNFIDDIVKYQPPEFHKTRIQRFFYYYCNQFQFGHYFQSKMLNFKGIEEAKNQINDYFEKQKEERFLEY